MAKTDIWMPIFIGDYLKDTRHLTTEEHGAYYLILLELWNKEGFLPIDTIHRIALKPRDKFAEIWKNISGFFTEKDGIISQKRLLKELKLSKKKRKACKNNGLKGGRPITKGLTPRLCLANQKGNPRETSSPSPSQVNTIAPKKVREPNILWDAVCSLWGFKPVTKSELSRIGKLSRDFKLKEATPELILLKGKAYKAKWPDVECSPEALLKHWDRLDINIKTNCSIDMGVATGEYYEPAK